MSKEIIKGALSMARLGYHVFPLLKKLQKGNNTRGTPKGWNHNAPDDPRSIASTLDLDKISDWTDHGEMVGYGVNPRNRRAVVLDVDIKGGKVGANSLKALIRDFGLSIETFCVKTQSGGLHLYYAYDNIPEGFYVKGTGIDGYPDIDLRCDMSFVNGPYEGGKYKVIKDLPTHSIPQELIEKLPLQPLTSNQHIIVQFDDADALSYGDNVLKGIIPDVIRDGERDNTLIRLIGSWARKYPIETTVILTKEAISRCEGPKIRLEDYIPKIETTYEKDNFKPISPEMLTWMEDHLILIAERKSVCDLSQKAHNSMVMKEAAIDIYKNWIYYIEDDRTGKKHKMYAFTAWMESPKRQSLKSFGYYPANVREFYCDIQDAKVANLYSPPFIDHKQPEDDYQRYIDKFLLFCQELFGDESEYMLDWVAHQIQKPQEKLTIAPVLISEIRGVGKNLFFDIIKNMVGKWNTTEADVTEAVDKFCEFATKHHLVLINEANVDVRDKRGVNMRRELLERLKSKITENMQTVEPKYLGRFNTRSFVNYLVAGNTMDALPVEEGDRRFHVIQINAVKRPRQYYDDLWSLARSPNEDADASNRAFALRDYFKEREITLLFKGDTAGLSTAKQEMIDSNKSSEQIEIDEACMNYYSIFNSNIITRELFQWYIMHKVPGGHRLSQGAIRDIFRANFKTISNGSRARQMLVKLPEQEMNGSILPEETKKCALYTVRRHGAYETADTKFLKAEYNKALKATEFGFKEPREEEDEDSEKSLTN
jgi:hypothetical protein